MAKQSVEVKITNQIIEIMNTGTCPWKQGWNNQSGLTPFNPLTGHTYTGLGNILIASFKAQGRLPAFVTANGKQGRFPKKGSKSIAILAPNSFIKKDKKTGEKKSVFYGFKYFNVFHYSDMNGIDHAKIEEKYATIQRDFEPIAKCEEVIQNMPNRPSIDHGGNRAFYRPSTDTVGMPNKAQFEAVEKYYSTLFHELGHSTMHLTRLDRKKGQEGLDTAIHEYSFEELVAELTACFIGSECGILGKEIEQSASYLKGWLSKLQSNPDWIIKASGEATKASAYILNQIKAKEA